MKVGLWRFPPDLADPMQQRTPGISPEPGVRLYCRSQKRFYIFHCIITRSRASAMS